MPWRSVYLHVDFCPSGIQARPGEALCDDFLPRCVIYVNFDLGVQTWLSEKGQLAFSGRLVSPTSNMLAKVGGHIVPSLSVP